MLEIERLCPQGDEKCAMGVDKKDIIARYGMYDSWNVLVAEEDGKIAGWTGLTVKIAPEKKEKYAYFTEIMVHPDFRRSGVATKLVKEAEKKAREMGADYAYCYIYDSNKASQFLFEKMGYFKMRSIKFPAVSTYKKLDIPPEYSIKLVDKKEIGDAAGLINEYNSGYIHFIPFTDQIFESHLEFIPGYGPENFWEVRDKENKIAACAGLWDSSELAHLYYAREPTAMKVMKLVFGALSHITKVPKFPAEGEHFRILYVVDYAFDGRQPDAMLALLKHLNNISIDRRQDFLMAVTDPEDDLLAVVKKLKPQIETWHVFAKSFEGGLPTFSPFYVDIRDMIP
ncbi:acetyltransferase (GNAT) family protein [Methanosarcina horonobensis HB-1 = JCM 15518]|uniref:Acetyltransferase (GNAT) family protein n=2 Tax=Methanosarcina horonobensis TaxID=418008 RepID=A0A0E3SJH5_9EURY|nr:acetyltransferase (GNAT) family protein [Methanosarcina horonobensis HB-1 = JCM 15518]